MEPPVTYLLETESGNKEYSSLSATLIGKFTSSLQMNSTPFEMLADL